MPSASLLRNARRRAGLSQRELARLANVPQSTVARIEVGALSPRADTLDRLLRAAGQTLSIEPLLGVGVDRSLIREYLQMTAAERVRRLKGEARSLRALDRAVLRDR